MTFLPLRLREAWNLGGFTPRQLAVRTWTMVNEREIMTRAAGVAFYAMLAFVPLLGLILTVVVQLLPDLTDLTGRGTGVGNMTVDQLRSTLQGIFPKEAYAVVEDQIRRLQDQLKHRPPIGLFVVGLAVTLWLASSLYAAIIDAMNRIYGVVETRSIVKVRLVAIALTIFHAAIFLSALVAIVAWPQILRGLHVGNSAAWLLTAAKWAIVLLMVLFSFGLTFYYGPDADTRWEWITPGSLLGTLAFGAFTWVFRIYVQDFANYNKTYGSLGGVMVLMFWLWVTSLVLLTAGQMNKIIEENSPLGKACGQKVDPLEKPDFAATKTRSQ